MGACHSFIPASLLPVKKFACRLLDGRRAIVLSGKNVPPRPTRPDCPRQRGATNMASRRRLHSWTGAYLALFALSGPGVAAEPDAETVAFFEKEIRPLLVERCQKCHGA